MLRLRALTAAAGLLALSTIAQAQDTAGESTRVWSGRVAEGGMVAVRNFNGPIVVVTASGDLAEVRAVKITRGRDPGDITFDVNESAGRTAICTVYRGRSACDDRGWGDTGRMSVRYTVSLPRGARLAVATGNGEVSVERAGSEVELRTGNGDVRVGETTGSVTASTGNGDVEIAKANGPVRANTGNGRIDVTTSKGPVSAHTGNGSIDVRMASLANDDDMEFVSGSGTIRVTLPAAFNGTFEGTTGNGELRSDFPIQMTGRLDPQHVRGTIGSGGPTIRLHTGNGRLELRRGSESGDR